MGVNAVAVLATPPVVSDRQPVITEGALAVLRSRSLRFLLIRAPTGELDLAQLITVDDLQAEDVDGGVGAAASSYSWDAPPLTQYRPMGLSVCEAGEQQMKIVPYTLSQYVSELATEES